MYGRSWIAALAGVLGGLSLVDLVLGPALASARLVAPITGFGLLLLGGLAGLLALVLGGIGLARTGAASGRRGRGLAWLGIVVGAGVLAAIVVAALPGRGLPRINDITTSPDDPPSFSAAQRDPANAGRDLGYPPEFAALQRAAYPDLVPRALAVPPARALERAQAAAKSLGWEIVEIRPEQGILEAREESGLFRFVDDVVVRVRPAAGGSVVDVRSKSRDGRGDLGANARRIRTFNQALAR
jgi:uncharacterized protein (DUF1499 family)